MLHLLVVLLGAEPDPALLARIADRARQLEAFERNSEVLLTTTAIELDGDGKATKVNESVMKLKEKNGATSAEVVKEVEDGKDITEAARAEEATDRADREAEEKKREHDGKKKKKKTLSAVSPFHPDAQADYAFALLAPLADTSQVRIGFSPKGEKTPELMMGDATVDVATGDVLALSMRPSKLPTFVNHLSIEAQLRAVTPAGRALSKLELRGEAGLAFLKKRFQVVTTFSDYRAVP